MASTFDSSLTEALSDLRLVQRIVQTRTSASTASLRTSSLYRRSPLPPLAEQRRIVAQVEALLARVQAARERLAKVPALLKRFRQSVLAAACSGQLTEDWREDEP